MFSYLRNDFWGIYSKSNTITIAITSPKLFLSLCWMYLCHFKVCHFLLWCQKLHVCRGPRKRYGMKERTEGKLGPQGLCWAYKLDEFLIIQKIIFAIFRNWIKLSFWSFVENLHIFRKTHSWFFYLFITHNYYYQ